MSGLFCPTCRLAGRETQVLRVDQRTGAPCQCPKHEAAFEARILGRSTAYRPRGDGSRWKDKRRALPLDGQELKFLDSFSVNEHSEVAFCVQRRGKSWRWDFGMLGASGFRTQAAAEADMRLAASTLANALDSFLYPKVTA